MLLKSLPAGAYFVIWHRTEQRVRSLFLWGHSFHHFSFDKYFWSFITCQVFFKEQGNAGQQDGQTPCSGNLPWEILQILEHHHLSWNLCHRLHIRPFLQWSLNILAHPSLSTRGKWASLHDWTHTLWVLPVLWSHPSCLWLRCCTRAAQGGLSIVHHSIILLALVNKTVVNKNSWVFFRWTAYHLAL